MDSLREIVSPYVVELLLGMMIVQFILVIAVLVTWIKFRRVRQQQKRLLRGVTRENLEHLIHEYTRSVHEAERQLDEAAVQLDELNRKLSTLKGKIGLVRYNALAEQGNNLSFSLALVDEEQNGVVISSLYGRHQTYAYAKPVVRGTSEYSLSKEEKEAIALAVGEKQEAYV